MKATHILPGASFRGLADPIPGGFDPASDGIQFVVRDLGNEGQSLTNATYLTAPIPPGPLWTVRGNRYVHTAPRYKLALKPTGQIAVKVGGQSLRASNGPVAVTLVLGATAADAAAGRCAERGVILCRSNALRVTCSGTLVP